ncbi:MAG: hypothetical protein U0Z44_02045 [Kouleothrix sp.]
MGITDLAGNPLASSEPATDETYTLDNTAPAATSFTRQPRQQPDQRRYAGVSGDVEASRR